MWGELAQMEEYIWPENIFAIYISETIKRRREIITKKRFTSGLMEIISAPGVSNWLK